MRYWASVMIFASMCLLTFVSAAREEMMGQYRQLTDIVVLTGGDVGDRGHMFRYESDTKGEDQFFGRFCDQDSMRPGMIVRRLVFRMDYVRNCWDKSYPGGVEYRRDHEHRVVYATIEQAQR